MSRESSEQHLSRLAEWAMATLGKAVIWGTVFIAAGAVLSGATGETEWVLWGLALGPLVFGIFLTQSVAPLPKPDSDE